MSLQSLQTYGAIQQCVVRSLTRASSLAVGKWTEAVVAADVNGDGHVDLISVNIISSTLTVLTNNGCGRFAVACSPAVGSYSMSVAAADLDGDGYMDLISASGYDSTLTVFLNQLTVVTSYSGNGEGLTNILDSAIVGGLTKNLPVLVPGGNTNTPVFVNGILTNVQ